MLKNMDIFVVSVHTGDAWGWKMIISLTDEVRSKYGSLDTMKEWFQKKKKKDHQV